LESRIASIDTFNGSLTEAFAPMSVTMTLEDDIDISRGDMIVRKNNQPTTTQDLDIMMCWLHPNGPRQRAKYILRHTTNEARAMLTEVVYKMDINTLHRLENDQAIGMNDIARVKLRSTKPILCDAYRRNRNTGSVLLIDEATNETVAAGMIV
jgi:sulfate adenylyltransferase subunit 1